MHGLIFGGFINVFLLETAMVGAVGKFWILAFLEAFKTKFNDSKKKSFFAGGALIIFTASSILDVGRGPGSVLDIFCIDY